jgi:acyl CoA:acetate/3-ketoacid CoA transferase beta subunit
VLVTDLAVFSIVPGVGLTLTELSPFARSVQQVRAATGCQFEVAAGVRERT